VTREFSRAFNSETIPSIPLKISSFRLLKPFGTARANGLRVARDDPKATEHLNSKHTDNMTTTLEPKIINGIDTDALRGAIEAITQDPSRGQTHWQAATYWTGGARSETRVTTGVIGGQRIAKNFRIYVDEPLELCGTNRHPNPQETLFAALNACMMMGYVACCALEGIELEELRIETEGDIDLRGFLGIDATVKPGYDQLRYTVHVKGNATPEQFEKIHRTVMATSPNYFNLRNPIPLHSRLVVE
jgi:uncharacterized OsmC-like protein